MSADTFKEPKFKRGDRVIRHYNKEEREIWESPSRFKVLGDGPCAYFYAWRKVQTEEAREIIHYTPWQLFEASHDLKMDEESVENSIVSDGIEGDSKTALEKQVGGQHYKSLAIQPAEYCQANRLPYCESSVIRYVTRHREKNGRQDLEKAIHCLELLIELEYAAFGESLPND